MYVRFMAAAGSDSTAATSAAFLEIGGATDWLGIDESGARYRLLDAVSGGAPFRLEGKAAPSGHQESAGFQWEGWTDAQGLCDFRPASRGWASFSTKALPSWRFPEPWRGCATLFWA